MSTLRFDAYGAAYIEAPDGSWERCYEHDKPIRKWPDRLPKPAYRDIAIGGHGTGAPFGSMWPGDFVDDPLGKMKP